MLDRRAGGQGVDRQTIMHCNLKRRQGTIYAFCVFSACAKAAETVDFHINASRCNIRSIHSRHSTFCILCLYINGTLVAIKMSPTPFSLQPFCIYIHIYLVLDMIQYVPKKRQRADPQPLCGPAVAVCHFCLHSSRRWSMSCIRILLVAAIGIVGWIGFGFFASPLDQLTS